jgi:glutamine amidotransferase
MSKRPKIALIDYGLGNLFSVARAIEAACGQPYLVSNISQFSGADGIILPGVGAFGDGIANLKARGLDELILKEFDHSTPILGICLGMQLMFEKSQEFGEHNGLGLIKGQVIKFPDNIVHRGRPLKVPHVGWHRAKLGGASRTCIHLSSDILKSFDSEYFYFVHSFYASEVPVENILTLSPFGDLEYCSSVWKKNFIGFQFHPEKSGAFGIRIYQDWIRNL